MERFKPNKSEKNILKYNISNDRLKLSLNSICL